MSLASDERRHTQQLRRLTAGTSGDRRWIEESDLTFEINEPDAYALEEALQLREKHGGEVVALCLGPERATSTIREALAKGADRAIHIEERNLESIDSLGVAKLLAAAVKDDSPDLILTGLQSDDLGAGQTGVILAEFLGMPHATIIMDVKMENGALRVKRELESGWFQWVAMPLPALLTIQSGINQLRYATLKGIMAAKKKEIRVAPPASAVAAHQQIVGLSVPEKSKKTQMIGGSLWGRPSMAVWPISAAMACTAARSSGEAAGKPASMTSTPRRASARATSSFSAEVMEAPGACSPSRRLVSKILT